MTDPAGGAPPAAPSPARGGAGAVGGAAPQRARGFARAGVAGRPHGLDGSFVVLYPQLELLEPGQRVTVGGRQARVTRRAGLPRRPVVRLDCSADRSAAESLRGAELLVAHADAPPLEEDEWWAEELEGCLVSDGERLVGRVRRVLALPSCEALEVARERRADLLVPLIADAVRSVDVAQRRIDVDLAFLGEA